MLNSKKHLRNSENFLQKHRAKEDSYTSLLQKVSKDATLKEYVNFSNKAEKIFRLKHLASQKQLLAEQHKTSLASRRQKLFDILSHENNAYKKELWSLDRASETLKSDLLSRIEKMHEIKEYRRKEFVKEQMDQLFEKNNEDMRQIKQERFRLENVKTLEGQILEKQQDMIKDYEENLLYQEYSRRMREKEVKKEIEKRMEYDKMIEGNARIINLQIVTLYF